MTMSTQHRAQPAVARSAAVEVATANADSRSAEVRITGPVAGTAVALLSTVLGIHLRAGRRYLTIDLGAGELGPDAVRCLAAAADAVATLGGALVVQDAAPGTTEAIDSLRRTPVRG